MLCCSVVIWGGKDSFTIFFSVPRPGLALRTYYYHVAAEMKRQGSGGRLEKCSLGKTCVCVAFSPMPSMRALCYTHVGHGDGLSRIECGIDRSERNGAVCLITFSWLYSESHLM